jgi:hypothetical protein
MYFNPSGQGAVGSAVDFSSGEANKLFIIHYPHTNGALYYIDFGVTYISA